MKKRYECQNNWQNMAEENKMIVALIEKIYSFFVGRFASHSIARRKQYRYFITYYIVDSDRNLLYNPHKIFINPTDAGYGESSCREKEEKSSLSTFQTLLVSTATRVGMGNLVGVVAAISVGGARIRLLDVAYGFDRFVYSICRGNAGTAS